MKVLHVLYQSLPTKVGSTIRSRDILMSQKEAGIDVLAVTSPFQDSEDQSKRIEIFNEISYYRCSNINVKETVGEKPKSFIRQVFKVFKIISFSRLIYNISKNEKVDIIHAHSTFFSGLAASVAAKRLKVPFVYEVRSLWEEHRVVVKGSMKNILQASFIRFLENRTIKRANKVIVLNKELMDNLVKRGFKPDKFDLILNAVNLLMVPSEKLIKRENEELTFGYIGSIITIEGLSLLIDCIHSLKERNVKLLIFGAGAQRSELEKIIITQNATNVFFMGEVRSDEVYKAYNQIDVIVNPRIKNKITNDVTPLKPLEAMAYKKLVIASDVGGMKEIITHGYNGLLFRADDKDDLKKTILEVCNNGLLHYNSVINNSYEFIRTHKSWRSNAVKYKDIYIELLKK